MYASWSNPRHRTSELNIVAVFRRGVANPSIGMPPKAKNFNFLNILSQNTRGLKTNNRIHELSTQINEHRTFAKFDRGV